MGTQGLVNPGGNPKAGYLYINEMRVNINRTTQIMDHHAVRIPAVALKPRSWVYMEIEKEPNDRYVTARKIYLLPHYILPEEKGKFFFMK